MNLRLSRFSFGLVGAAFVFCSYLLLAKDPKNVKAKGINLQQWERTELKAHILAETGSLVPGGQGLIFATEFQMVTFGKGGTNDVEVIIEAPEAYLDHENKKAWSEKSLKAFTPSTNYLIEGTGFIVQREGLRSVLNISNDVHTTIRRKEAQTGKLLPPIHIYSDDFQFVSSATDGPDERIAHYTENVRVDDPDMQMTSGSLRVVIPDGTNEVSDIVARENVKIRSKTDGSEAAGQYGFYTRTEKGESIILSGDPVWKNGLSRGRAKQFIFDRKNNIVYAYSNATVSFPRQEMATSEIVPAKGKTNAIPTNALVDISADFLEIALPTNRLAKRMLARTNVVIVSSADKTRATASEARFDEASGVLELIRNATWQSDQTVAGGDTIVINRTNRTFRSTGNATLRLPANNSTNQFIEIHSSKYFLQTNIANFDSGVSLEFIGGKAPGSLICDRLEMLLRSNEVETILAYGNAKLTLNIARGSNRTLLCDEMTIRRSLQTGNIQILLADKNVSLIEKDSKGERKLTAQNVKINFGKTNEVESLLAERDVKVESGDSWATGQRAFYTLNKGEELFEITGTPIARRSEKKADGTTSKHKIINADVLRWDPTTGEVSARGPWELEPE